MSKLTQLAYKHGTDKTYYTEFYSLLLESRRESTKAVLEIGIGTVAAMQHVPNYVPGASLLMWREYFPDAMIYGADIEPSVLFTEDRIRTFQCNQASPYELLRMADRARGPFDLILDDGSHDYNHQIDTAITLSRFLSHGGIYIIEDVNAPAHVLKGVADLKPFFVNIPAPDGKNAKCVVFGGQ